ncbi:hypothetical protein A9986_07765 [Solibacillus silvestris]|nr:hypothetical protein [Solibacillus silvestris]OBW58833.1 hypothetical protein A9986_07765 [Solibacillus silvestris]
MKKNLKVGLIAGLLITPAIVAQAGEAEASETPTPFNVVASITAEGLLNSFKAVNEESTSATLTQERTIYNTYKDDEIYADIMPLIDAKLTYLEKYTQLKQDAAKVKSLISKLTNSNKNLVADRKAALEAIENLNASLENAGSELSNAVNGNAGTFLETLLYYGENGQTDFNNKYVTAASISHLQSFEEQTTAIEQFIENHISPITTLMAQESFSKESFISVVANARNEFNDITDLAFKNVLKVQLVENNTGIEQFIKNAESDIKKSQTVEDKIKDLVDNPPTATTFNSKVNALVKEYGQLTAVQKKLVPNADELKPYENVLNVVYEITRISKLSANTEGFREEAENVGTLYNALDPLDTRLVVNYDKLLEMQAAIEIAQKVETEIAKIDSAKYEEKSSIVTDARAAYNALSTIERKYVLKELLDLLTSWEKSTATAATINKQIDAIKTDMFANMDDEKLTDTKKRSTTISFITKVRTAESSYAKIEENERELVSKRGILEAFIPIVDIVDKVVNLNVTSSTYLEDLTTAENKLNEWDSLKEAIPSDDTENIEKLHQFLTSYLRLQKEEQSIAAKLDADILVYDKTELVDLRQIDAAREKYNSLSANGKRLVKNIKVLTEIEKSNKAVLSTIQAISKIDVMAKDFTRKATTAETSFNKLAEPMQGLVYNRNKLVELLPFAKLMLEIDAIRSTTAEFKVNLSKVQNDFANMFKDYNAPSEPVTDLENIQLRLFTEYGKKLKGFETIVSDSFSMESRIDALQTKSGEAFITDLAEVSAAYKKLDSATKRNVGNAKVLTELERDYKASLKVIELIEKLPVHTDRNFPSKVAAAQKAYERLTDKQKQDVYNYGSKLSDLLKVADLINRIEKLRVGSKTYEAEVAAIRADYAALSVQEQELVHNITKLASAEQGVSDAKKVVALIDAAIPTAEGYIQKLIDARNGYDSLTKSDQRLVTNYKDLTTRERGVKPVLKLDNDILALDPSNARTFISKYQSAEKAYEKLTMSERALLVNSEKLLGDLATIYNVVNTINSIKLSSKTFVEETAAARALYNELSAELATQVSNLPILQEHELNVEGGAKVDAMIRALNAAPANEFIAKIKEAREAYKSLSSANKKGVTLEPELKEQEKYIKPIEAAINAIEGLSNPRNDLSRQFNTVNNALKKLDDKQKEYVTNMDQYSNLSNVIHVYTLIAGLKPSDKYYQGNMEAAKLAYDKLSEEEKLKVTNYYKLQEAVLDMTEVQKVTTIIASLNSSSSSFGTDVTNALAAYKALPSGSKRQVLNYSVLQQAEKDLKAAERVIKQIEDLDATLRTYASRAKSAKTAYERLTNDQKSLVKNYNKLQAAIFELGL